MAVRQLQPAAGRDAQPPAVPRPVGALASGFFAGLSRLRGARVFHPKGIGYSAVVNVDRPRSEYAGAPLFAETGRYPAVVRLSYAVGLPDRWPDALGLAFRLLDVHGPGRHQDFLLITSGASALTHHLILPAPRGFRGHSYSSLLPYRIGDRLRMVGARPGELGGRTRSGALPDLIRAAARGDVRFELALGTLAGRWRAVAEMRLEERLDDELVERLAFNPWNTGGGLRPVGPLMGLRRPSYAGSQRGRGVVPGIVGPWR
jgi:hypothetical protein